MDQLADSFVVEMHAIDKIFPGVKALDKVDLSLSKGEIRGLVGKNGAGKSTLINILTGIYPRDGGEIRVNGEIIHSMTTSRAKQIGITCVHQHSQLVPSLSIAENIFCGSLPVRRSGFIDWAEVNRKARERLGNLGMEIDVTRKVEGLSVAERQMLEIAKALFADASVIILDEATAPLPKNEVEMLFSFVRRQSLQGATFIYISHYLEEVFELCDNITVLKDGRKVGDYPVSSLDQAGLIRLISGGVIERFQRKHVGSVDPVLQIRGLTRPGSYKDINLTVGRGEILALTGLEGCGKAALARGLFGLEPLGSGEVSLGGKPYHADKPEDALLQGLAYLPRDRHGYGILGMRPVQENISLPILERLLGSLKLLDLKKEQSLVTQLIEKLSIKTASMQQSVQFLSGGNQQKVVFAKLVSTNPNVLLLDEPTQGVDVQAKVEIMKIVDQLAREGVAIIIISEEIRELIDICDRIVVLYRGECNAEFLADDRKTSIEAILSAVEGSVMQHAD